MDVHHIKTLIDRGYRLGLHGHQHKPDAQRHNLFLSGLQTMSVVSAGSLCAGSRDLPHGFVRQYNVIEINDDFMRARVHVREMRYHSVFCAGRIPSVSDRSFVDVSWTRAPRDISVNTALGGGAATVSADRIEGLVRSEELEEAEAETRRHLAVLGYYGRQLLTRIFEKGARWSDIEEHLDSPKNAEELALLVHAKIKLRHWDSADKVVRDASKTGLFAANFVRDLTTRLNLERDASN